MCTVEPWLSNPHLSVPLIIQNDVHKFLKQEMPIIVEHVIHCLLFNMVLAKNVIKCLIVSKHGLTNEVHCQTNLHNKATLVLLQSLATFFLRLVLIVERWITSFIKVGVVYACVLKCLKNWRGL